MEAKCELMLEHQFIYIVLAFGGSLYQMNLWICSIRLWLSICINFFL